MSFSLDRKSGIARWLLQVFFGRLRELPLFNTRGDRLIHACFALALMINDLALSRMSGFRWSVGFPQPGPLWAASSSAQAGAMSRARYSDHGL
jgi:hypothetical protein